jgi:hypothetical protein
MVLFPLLYWADLITSRLRKARGRASDAGLHLRRGAPRMTLLSARQYQCSDRPSPTNPRGRVADHSASAVALTRSQWWFFERTSTRMPCRREIDLEAVQLRG